MLPIALSNNLKPYKNSYKSSQKQRNINTSQGRISEKRHSFKKSFQQDNQQNLNQLIRKHSSEAKKKKILKSYDIRKNSESFNIVIPSFVAFQSTRPIKADQIDLISAINQSKNSIKRKEIPKPSQENINKKLLQKSIEDFTEQPKAKTQRKNHLTRTKFFYPSKRMSFLQVKKQRQFEDKQLIAFKSQILPITLIDNTKAQDGFDYFDSNSIKFKKRQISDIQLSQRQRRFSNQSNQILLKTAQANISKIEIILYKKYSHNFELFMQNYCRRLELPENTKLFIINSSDFWIKQALLKRGWKQNADSESRAYHLKWTAKIQRFRKKKFSQQISNHFQASDLITSKGQFAKHTRKSQFLRKIIPRTYDLGSQLGQFRRNFQQTKLLSGFKKIVTMIDYCQKEIELNPLDISSMIKKMHQKQLYVSENLEKQNNLPILHIPYAIQLAEYAANIICRLQNIKYPQQYHISQKTVKNLLEFCDTDLYQTQFNLKAKINKQKTPLTFNKDNPNFYSCSNPYNYPSVSLVNVILSLHQYLCKKFNTYKVEGCNNIWIVKNRNSSKGVGIFLTNQYHQICSKIQNRIAQKYIQNCLLYQPPKENSRKYKFDLRIWVAVISFDPLIVYYYQNFYGRLCSGPYNLTQLDQLTHHLTNYKINRKKFQKNIDEIDQSILSYEAIFDIMNSKNQKDTSLSYAQTSQSQVNIFYTKLQEIIENTLQQYKGAIQVGQHQENNFQFYGFDVLVSDILSLHLLEVNLSPACDYKRNKWLENNVQQMANQLLDIILHQPRQSQDCPKYWKLIKQKQ